MAKLVFKPELFPINIFDGIAEAHPVRLVDSMAISGILQMYKGAARPHITRG